VHREETAEEAARKLPELGASSSLADHLRYAALNNTGLEAAFQRWYAAAQRVPQVRALPDPNLLFGVFLQEVETAAGPQNSKIGLSQRFPWFGELQAREDAAASMANAAWRRYEAVRLDLVERVSAALYELRYLSKALTITEENLELLKQFEEIARARYRVAAGGHPELIRVQVELGELENRLTELRELRGPYIAKLNAALNRPVDAPVHWPIDLPDEQYAGDITDLVDLADLTSPALLAMDDELHAARANEDVARAAGRPNLTVGLDYTFVSDAPPNPTFSEGGDDPILLTFGVSLPLDRSKYDAAVREAIARRLAIGHDRVEELNRMGADLRMALFDHTDAGRRVDLYEHTLIPKATESMRASMGAFRAGEQSMLDLLETERTLLEFGLSLERARADRAISLARLERLVGEELETVHIQPAPGDQGEEGQR
jgi:outer membrane protein TolC